MPTKYTREILAAAAVDSRSLADVLRALGLKVTGSAHAYIKQLLVQFDIDTSHFVGQAWRKRYHRH